VTPSDGRAGPTRERLITTATGLFRRQGIARTGIGDICERAGVTKGVFSHHYPGGKTDLVTEVIRRNAREVEQALAMRLDEQQPAADLVDQLFAEYTELLRVKGTDFGCPVAASVVDTSAGAPPVRAAAESAFDAWRDALRLNPAVGRLNDLDSLIVAALEGGILIARAENDPTALERIGSSLSQLIRRTAAIDD
jgi:AcrR family transcriptional regulator